MDQIPPRTPGVIPPAPAATVAVCIVTLDCREVVEACLESVARLEPPLVGEVIVVDNGSRDGTAELVRRRFPQVRVVENAANLGFTRATNQAIRLGGGEQILWLNPDTVLQPNSLAHLQAHLSAHPEAGVVGPRVLNEDGSFQPQCRRGLPTPWAALCYLLGLHRWRSGDARFNGYLLGHLPADQPMQVAAVSGCCLLARRRVWDAIGPLDEAIFGFGEDVEWCVRARNAGWQVWYVPKSVITHLKGRGGAQSRPWPKVRGMHQAMWVFYRKHLAARYGWPVTVLVAAGIAVSLAMSSVGLFGKRLRRALVGRAGTSAALT